ncbi:MAG TPA: hypothetical protein EYQ61_05960 [Dehalococcoidia bacterium]|nr:hypothetical protein [Dehalococcoidia bacterium]
MNSRFPITKKNISISLRLRLLAITAITVLAITFPTPFLQGGLHVASAQAPADEIIGIVVNGTDGGSVPTDMEVLLMSIDLSTNQIIPSSSTVVDEDGIFRFRGLLSDPGLSYRVVADSGIYTPSVDMANQENWGNVQLTIYDDTTSLEDITLSSYVMMIPTIDARTRQLGVLSVINVDNRSDRIWIPNIDDPNLTGLDLLRFNLPDGFTDLSIESELPTGNILEINSGFAMTNPIPPGEAAILISYIISYEADGFEFGLKMPYGVDKVRMLLPDGGGSITGNGLGGIESVVVAESVFNSVEGINYAVDDVLNMVFSELPQPTALQSLSEFFKGRTYVIVIIWIVGLALLGILGCALYSSRRKKSDPNSDNDDVQTNRSDIIAGIASLDEEFEAGKIEEDDYNDQRDELKRLALDVGDDADAESADAEKFTFDPKESDK